MINQLLASILFASVVLITGGGGGGGGGPGLSVLEEIDFEGSGCADGTTSDTCSAGGNADYATSPAPLTGSFSLYIADESFIASSNTTEASDVATMDFQIRWPGSTENRFLLQMRDGSNATLARVDQVESSRIRLKCGAFDLGTNISLTSIGTTTYYVRLRHDPDGLNDDICHIAVSASAYGASDVGSDTVTATTGGNLGGSGANWEFHARATGAIIVDEVVICDGDAGTTEGRCDT